MQIGKQKSKTVEKLKTRRCVVRLKRVKTQPNTKMARKTVVVPAKAQQQPSTAKKRSAVVGPASAKSATIATTSFKAKERITKTPEALKNAKLIQEQKKLSTTLVTEELPPTIAAGRSRRVHKPNPKYASEDILTPKILKPMINKESNDQQNQQHKTSAAMSLEDFFNKDTSDEDEEIETSHKLKSRTMPLKQQKASDSDFTEDLEDSDTSLSQRQIRGRSKKKITNESMVRRSSIALTQKPTTLNRTAPATKINAPTQLQQLRRSLNANTISPLAMANRKRKLEENNSNSTLSVANKRLQLITSTPKTTDNSAKNTITRRQSINPVRESYEGPQQKKLSTGQSTSQINKRSATPVEKKQTTTSVEGRKQILTTEKKLALPIERKQQTLTSDKNEKKPINALNRSSSVSNIKTFSASKMQQNTTQQRSPSNTSTTANLKRNSLGKLASISTPNLTKSIANKTSPLAAITTKKTSSIKSLEANKSNNAKTTTKRTTDSPKEFNQEEPPTQIVIDDFETMPTFTIVNINDIINKKGDVLISESPIKSKDENEETTALKTEPTKTQKQQQSRSLAANKSSLDRNKRNLSPEAVRTSKNKITPFLRKPIEKVENKTLNKIINRNSASAAATPPPATVATTRSATRGSEKKPAPRILNSTVARKTQPIKPVISNLDISSDDPSCSLSLYSDEDQDDFDADGDDDGDYMVDDNKLNTSASDLSDNDIDFIKRKPKPKQTKKPAASGATLNKNKTASMPTTAAKENSASANNCLPKKPTTALQSKLQNRNLSPEKIVVEREGNKIIKKITCFETWFVINIPPDGPEELERNSLDLPLIKLANATKTLKLPSEKWTTKVTLFELKKSTAKGELTLYTGDLSEQNIDESDRDKYQPSCVMFRRQVNDRKLNLPYDRAVIFKNKTFFTNIEGKNVKLVGAPLTIRDINEVETLLQIVDDLTLKSNFVEPAAMMI